MSVGAFTTVRVAVALVRLSPVVVLWMVTLKVLPLSSMVAGGIVYEAAVKRRERSGVVCKTMSRV